MEKIMIMGSFSQKFNVDLVQHFVEKFSNNFEIILSGIDFKAINHLKSKNVYTSESHNHWLANGCTASYVIVLGDDYPEMFRRRLRLNQKLFYISGKDVFAKTDKKSFEIQKLLISDYDEVMILKKSEEPTDIGKLPIAYFDKNDENIFDKISSEMKIIPHERQNYVFVLDSEESFFDKNHKLRALLKRIKHRNDNIYLIFVNKPAISNRVLLEEYGNMILYFNVDGRLICSLLSYSGENVIFEDDMVENFTEVFLNKSGIGINHEDDKSQIKNEELDYVEIHSMHLSEFYDRYSFLTDRVIKEEGFYPTSYYRDELKTIYDDYQAARIKISIIMCCYNTPYDLLLRAVKSGLHQEHKNIEVILVDDGSATSYEDRLLFDLSETEKKKFRYFYKENQGQGLARNYGVKQSTGDYVFYLDSDDTITSFGLKLMLAHALYFDVDLVLGKRVICNEKGQILNESLPELYGSTFKVYLNDKMNLMFKDQMPNNKLIKLSVLIENDIWFKTGLYEDAYYNAKLCTSIKEYHYTNIHVHNWYKYGDGKTSSSKKDYSNFVHKYNAIQDVLSVISDMNYTAYAVFVFISDFSNMYFSSYKSFSEDEKLEFFKKIREFSLSMENYLSANLFAGTIKSVFVSAVEDDFKAFDYLLNRFGKATDMSQEIMDDYICFTHYHLYTAIVRTVNSGKKSRLILFKDYIPFTNELAKKIEETDIFESVDIFEYLPSSVEVVELLNKRPEDAYTIIPSVLFRKFDVMFGKYNRLDNVYIFSDSLPYWYYIEREFENIYKLEDAYNSVKREIDIFNIHGKWGIILDYEGTVYPLMKFKSPKIKGILVSNPIEGLEEIYQEKIIVDDTKKLFEKNKVKLHSIFANLYDLNTDLSENTVMILTQPLANFRYCTPEEQLKMYKAIASRYKKKNVVFKAHPADKLDYRKLGYKVLPGNVPIEIYNTLDKQIAEVVTFGSSSIETVTFAKKKTNLFPLHDFNWEDVPVEIQKIIQSYKEPNIFAVTGRRGHKLMKLAIKTYNEQGIRSLNKNNLIKVKKKFLGKR